MGGWSGAVCVGGGLDVIRGVWDWQAGIGAKCGWRGYDGGQWVGFGLSGWHQNGCIYFSVCLGLAAERVGSCGGAVVCAEWMAEIRFDAGIALPEMRADKVALQPKREWLVGQSAEQHAELRREAEKYLRSCFHVYWVGGGVRVPAEYTMHFPEWDTDPPVFASPFSDLGFAYFSIQVVGEVPVSGGALEVRVAEGDHPDFLFGYSRMGSGNYITAYPGKAVTLWTVGAEPPGAGVSFLSFLDYGYRHVIPEGWDHVLFIAALCCLGFSWRPLLTQSLVFTVGHTITLGLSISGVLPSLAPASMTWVEVVIAGTIVYVAVENLVTAKVRLGDKIREAGNIGMPLIAANLGVELGQVTVIVAVLLGLGWAKNRDWFPVLLKGVSAVIAVVGIWWVVERVLGAWSP